jgi:hypothetical protein
MTNQTSQTAIAPEKIVPEKILVALSQLSAEQQQQVFDFVEFLAQRQPHSATNQTSETNQPTVAEPSSLPKKQRTFGQYAGRIKMSADFDDPLPDTFWLGDA